MISNELEKTGRKTDPPSDRPAKKPAIKPGGLLVGFGLNLGRSARLLKLSSGWLARKTGWTVTTCAKAMGTGARKLKPKPIQKSPQKEALAPITPDKAKSLPNSPEVIWLAPSRPIKLNREDGHWGVFSHFFLEALESSDDTQLKESKQEIESDLI